MLRLVFAYLTDRKLTTALNVLLVAIAVALLTILLSVSMHVTKRLTQDAEGIDLVVGAKGSPLQLILSSIFHVDRPVGNIPAASIDMLRRDPAVAQVVPLALGDNFRGFRIVGTEEGFLKLQGAALQQGRLNAAEGEALIGAEVARSTGAKLGQRFLGSHGLGNDGDAHDQHPFTVVGILKPTGRVIDRLIVTSLETVWDVHGIAHTEDAAKAPAEESGPHADEHHKHQGDHNHEHEHKHEHKHEHAHAGGTPETDGEANALQRREAPKPEVTSLLVTYRNAAAAVRLPSAVNRQTQMQAAVPATETARFLSLFGASIAGAEIFGWLMAAVAGLAIFVTLFNAVRAREGDLALLRVMGASPLFVSGAVVVEGLIVAVLGMALGIGGGIALLWFAAAQFGVLRQMGFDPFVLDPATGWVGLGVLAIAALAAILPALRVYAADVARLLARHS